jgi:hypothetical protein
MSTDGHASLLHSPPDREYWRRLEKLEAKWEHQAARPPDPWERFRILTESIGEARHVIDLSDHRARYALVVLGVLNAGAFALMTRGHLFADLRGPARPWLLGLLLLYGAMNLVFVLYAIESLKPRRLDQAIPSPGRSNFATGSGEALGLLFWEAVARRDLAGYQKAWQHATMAQINAEAEAIFHTLSRALAAKVSALHRLYVGLVVLVVVAFAILCLFTALTL